MLTLEQLQSLDVLSPADQEAAYNQLRIDGNAMQELEDWFDKWGADAATKLFLRVVEASCSDEVESERLTAALLVAGYCHVLRTRRRLAN